MIEKKRRNRKARRLRQALGITFVDAHRVLRGKLSLSEAIRRGKLAGTLKTKLVPSAYEHEYDLLVLDHLNRIVAREDPMGGIQVANWYVARYPQDSGDKGRPLKAVEWKGPFPTSQEASRFLDDSGAWVLATGWDKEPFPLDRRHNCRPSRKSARGNAPGM
jgi:hypothetical protein